MKIRHAGGAGDKIELQMTPMIDIVFQLLIFFIMTFKIVALEGDFNIKMPVPAPREGDPPRETPTMRLRLMANDDGSLADIRVDEQKFAKIGDLRGYVIKLLGKDRGPESLQQTQEVELVCDYHLDYQYVIEAITAITAIPGKKPGDGVIKLIEKIKFGQPQKKPPS